MFAGHIGVALAIGRVERRVNVGVFVAAALLLDFALWLLILLGWESVSIPADFALTHQPEFVFPFSHGLVAAIAWSALAGALGALGYAHLERARWRAAALVAAAAFSHWLLDALVHRAEMPLAGVASRAVGLGLWDSMPVALAVEAAIVVLGMGLFFPGCGLSRGKSLGLAVLCLVTLAFTVAGMTIAPPPPSALAMAGSSWVVLVLVCALAAWLGRPPVSSVAARQFPLNGFQGIAVVAAAIAVAGFPLAVGAAGKGAAAGTACPSPSQPVREERFVPIGGIEQWVTIRGASCANPVILFLHGGPGNPLSPFADAIHGSWEREFTLVQWDQRGAGRTFGRNPPSAGSTLTLERMTEDGVELADYLVQRLGKTKIILLGGSWGSVLGVHMAKSRPDLFHAYVGVSQVVSYRDNPSASYAKVLGMARTAADQGTIAALEAIGPPPWENPRNFGILRRATRAYEAKASAPAPKSWWVPASGYDSPPRLAEYEEGEDFSYLQFVGLKGDGMFSRVDLPKLGPAFDIPVFLIHGSEDLVATPGVARQYFDGITAPRKEFVLVPQTGHDPNPPLVEAEYRILSQRVRPLAK